MSACTSGRGQLVLGDEEGSLYFVSRQLDVSSFHAYELCVTHLYQLKQHNILVTVGVRIFHVNHLHKFCLYIGMVMEFICAKYFRPSNKICLELILKVVKHEELCIAS